MPRLWLDTAATLIVAGGGAQNFKSLMTSVTGVQTALAQMTLLRTIVGINIGLTIHDAGEGSQLVSVGIGIASQEAFAAGLGALSDPELDADFPTRGWIWRSRYRVFGFAADQPAVFTQRVDLDLRSQRKLERGESFMIATNEDVEGTSSPITIHGLIRQLWLVS